MRHAARTFASSLLALLLLTLPATAQELSYTETTRMEMGGMMGSIMSMMGEGGDETQTVHIQGTQMRRDGEESSSIMDFSTGDMIMLNHDDRTFMRMNFREMMEGMQGQAADAQARADSVRADMEARGEEMPEYEVRFSTERTGASETISGYDAEQVLMIVEFEGQVDAENPQQNPFAGMRMAVVTDMWLSTDFPQWDVMADLRDDLGEAWGSEGMFGGSSGMEGMGAMGAGMGARMQQAMEEQQEALQELEGVPVRTVMNWISLAPDVELDAMAALEQDLGGGGGMDMGGSAAAAARSALSGLFGGGGDDEEEEEEPENAGPAGQSVIMRAVTEIHDVEEGSVDPSIFQVPDGYTERAMPGMPGGGR